MSALLLAVTVLADIAISPQVVVLTVFYALAPLLAAAALGPIETAGFALAAFVLAFASGAWNLGGAQYWIRVIDVALVGVLSVVVAAIRVRREADLRTSQRIASIAQEALLPVLPDRIGSIAFATRYHSATRSAQIGGDFFDFVADRHRVRLILGDVSGKGVDAVSQAARVIRAFRQYGASEPDLVGVARRIHDYVHKFWDLEYYATAVLVEIGAPDQLTVVSAGHPAPLHAYPGRVTELPVRPCLPLGVGPADAATQHTWRASDRLLLYTDGLIEARDRTGTFLPRATIETALQLPGLEPSLDALLDRVQAHSGGFSDDLALLLMANAPLAGQRAPTAGQARAVTAARS